MLFTLARVFVFVSSEAAAAEKRVARQQERQKLVELLERKNNEELEGLSKEEIEKKLAALDGE